MLRGVWVEAEVGHFEYIILRSDGVGWVRVVIVYRTVYSIIAVNFESHGKETFLIRSH